ENDQTVFLFQTNGTEIWKQPAATYSIEASQGQPISHLLLTFADSKTAAGYGEFVLNDYNKAGSPPSEIINKKGFECYRYTQTPTEQFVCRGDAAVMVAKGHFDLPNFGFEAKKIAGHDQPLTWRWNLHRDRIEEYLNKVS